MIVDAKYKVDLKNLDTEDMHRFYSYLLDYMEPDK